MQFIAIEQTCVCVVKSAVTHRCICFRLVVGKTLESFGMVCWWEQIHINMWDISQRMRDFRLRQTQLPSALHSHAISTVNIQHIAIVHFTTTSRLRKKEEKKLWRGRVSEIFGEQSDEGCNSLQLCTLWLYTTFSYSVALKL